MMNKTEKLCEGAYIVAFKELRPNERVYDNDLEFRNFFYAGYFAAVEQIQQSLLCGVVPIMPQIYGTISKMRDDSIISLGNIDLVQNIVLFYRT